MPGSVPDPVEGNRSLFQLAMRAGRRAAAREQLEDAARLFELAAQEARGIPISQVFRFRALLALAEVHTRQDRHDQAEQALAEARSLK
jgi:hypothetical protein